MKPSHLSANYYTLLETNSNGGLDVIFSQAKRIQKMCVASYNAIPSFAYTFPIHIFLLSKIILSLPMFV